MTLEEAAERVLLGATYLPCIHCEGERFVGPIECRSSGVDTLYLRALCIACEGYGTFLDPVYAFACGMTSAGLPPRPEHHGIPLQEMARRQMQWELEWGQMKTVVNPVIEAVVKLHQELPFKVPKK